MLKPSLHRYSLPFPQKWHHVSPVPDSPAHKGVYEGALDFLLPAGTTVLTPYDGTVTNLEDSFDSWGSSPEYKDQVNYLTLEHPRGEFSQLLHLAKGSIKVKVGQKVKRGEVLAQTGFSGWMTAPHLHFFIFHKNSAPPGFLGRRIRFQK